MVDPGGGTWLEMEDVVSHRGRHGFRYFLIRYKGFGPSFDEWKRGENVSEQLVNEYDEMCRVDCPQGPMTAAALALAPPRAPASIPARPDPIRRSQAQRQDRDERAARRQK